MFDGGMLDGGMFDGGMFDGMGLAVSLPAREIGGVDLPGSLFDLGTLSYAPLPDDLRLAIDAVAEACSSRGTRLVFVARPEIFTNGETLAWLKQQLGGIRDHLCISDGATIRMLPGMRNHVFLYQLGKRDSAAAFDRFTRRAPELFSGIASQVNTALGFGSGFSVPPTVLLQSELSPSEPPQNFLQFYLNPGSLADSLNRTVNHPTPAAALSKFARATYIPLTEVAAACPGFCDFVAAAVAKTYFDRSSMLILRPPLPRSATITSFNATTSRLSGVLAALGAARVCIPRAVAENVFFSVNDLAHGFFSALDARVDLILHESFDFWRYSPADYAVFDSILVVADHHRRAQEAATRSMLAHAFGRDPELRWLVPDGDQAKP